MKEILAIIRQNKVNTTKEALAKAGFPSFTCRKCLGRGKKGVDGLLLQTVIETGELPVSPIGEYMTETQRLIPKRVFTIMVSDDKVDDAVKVFIDTNQTGNPGDGKIFILPVTESYRVRTAEGGTSFID